MSCKSLKKRKEASVKQSAYLFGPFIGELYWEIYRFAPYAIRMKKTHPECAIVVFTRSSRFDLYGKYADVLVPLKLNGDDTEKQNCFKLDGITLEDYKFVAHFLKSKYKKKYNILDHFYPNILWRYRVKWQFPRHLMDYNFLPRKRNGEIVEEIYGDSTSIVLVDKKDYIINDNFDYEFIMVDKVSKIIKKRIQPREAASFLGCLIELLRKVDFVIGDMNSTISRISLLLNKPLISINETMSYDSISLLNPFKTLVINCKNIEEGIEIYENNF